MRQKTLTRLQNNRLKLTQTIRQLEGKLQEPVDPDIDEGDPSLSDYGVTLALLHQAKQDLDAIDHALQQGQTGQYGMCEVCAGAIDPERLKIFPQATLCINCKRAQERASHRRAA